MFYNIVTWLSSTDQKRWNIRFCSYLFEQIDRQSVRGHLFAQTDRQSINIRATVHTETQTINMWTTVRTDKQTINMRTTVCTDRQTINIRTTVHTVNDYQDNCSYRETINNSLFAQADRKSI
jgi:ABC-type microcin C transport system permease subunit YejE